MTDKLAALLGGMLNDYVSGTADLAAGHAGAAATGSKTSAGDVVPSTNEVMLQKRLADVMKPVYQMASQAKDHEAKRIRETMFGISPTETKANPIAKGVSDFLAMRLYNRDIQPYIKAMEEEAKNDVRNAYAASAGYKDQWKNVISSFIAHPDAEVSQYGKTLSRMANTADSKTREALQNALNGMKRRWEQTKQADKLSLLHQLDALQSTQGQPSDFSKVQKKALTTMKAYLDSLKFNVGQDNVVRGFKKFDRNNAQMEDLQAAQDAVQME